MSIKNTVCHLTSAHARYDIRIFVKQCQSLAKLGFETNLIVSDGKGQETKNGVNIIDVGPPKPRLKRMLFTARDVYQKALEIDADIYHAHDPELLPYCRKLIKKGKIVIFDAHEDLPKQILSKPYLNSIAKTLLSKAFSFYEKKICSSFSGIIGATPFISEKFAKINTNSVNINNYPIVGELNKSANWADKSKEIVYVGGISQIRGIKEIVQAMKYTEKTILNIGGKFSEPEVEKEVKGYETWKKVRDNGFLSRAEVANLFAKSMAGIVTFLPVPNHIDAQPNKMFEYMSAGLPIITSNFPLWKEIVEGNNCGICVDPKNPRAIGEAIMKIVDNPKQAEIYGENGRQAILTKYNWSTEFDKLIKMYDAL